LTLLPFFAILASRFWTGGFTELASRWKESFSSRIVIIAAIILITLLFLDWGLELSRDADKLAQFFGPDGNHSGFSY